MTAIVTLEAIPGLAPDITEAFQCADEALASQARCHKNADRVTDDFEKVQWRSLADRYGRDAAAYTQLAIDLQEGRP